METEFNKAAPMSRMTAILHFFNLNTMPEKKEYSQLTPADREELAKELRDKHGYNVTDLGK